MVGDSWGHTKGWEVLQSLVLGKPRQMASDTLGSDESFSTALPFINIVLGALGTALRQHTAVIIEAPLKLGSVGSVAASLQ